MENEQTYIAFLRGINVGGHHKVPMADLRKEMEKLAFSNVKTLLNSGNVIFDTKMQNEEELEDSIRVRLTEVFGFEVPVIVINSGVIDSLLQAEPFRNITITKDIKFSVSFLKEKPKGNFPLPYRSDDQSFQILSIYDKMICSVIDLSKTGTIKAMEILEKTYGKNLTTRNWNTILRIKKIIKN